MKSSILLLFGIGAAVSAILLWFPYLQPEEQTNTADILTNSTDFRLVEFERADLAAPLITMQEQVCGQPARSDWLAEKVHFAYLQPEKTVYRIPCSINPAGLYHYYFYESDGKMEVVDYGEPNRGESSLFTVNSPMKAAEYVILFSIVQGSDLAIHHFATSDSQYEQMLGRCNSKDVSPTKGMMISESDGRYVV